MSGEQIWNSCKGYVMIRLKGVSLEKSLELLRQNGIKLLLVERHAYTVCDLVMSVKDFKKIRYILRRRNVTVKILKKGTIILRLKALRRRKMLLLGPLLLALLLFGSTLFVWDVKIEGDLSLHGYVRAHLQEMGIGTGMLKGDVDTEEFNRSLLIKYPQMSWAQTQIVGMQLIIKVVDADQAPQMLETGFANVVAKKDALVYSIIPLNGQAAVLEGAIVKKGDILIAGTMTHLDKKARYVRARGVVLGRVWYYGEAIDSVYAQNRVTTGRQSRQRWFCIGDWALPIETGELFADYDEKWTATPLCSLWIPVKLVTRQIYEVSPQMIDRDLTELKDRLRQEAIEQALSRQDYRKILNTSVKFTELGGGLIKAEAALEVLEEIGETVPLEIPDIQEESIWSRAAAQE
ncbi:MAG: sporulation protein YqfD [Christensenellales bacterium]